MPSVTMFSLAEVGSGDEEGFIQFFKQVRQYMSEQPGFIQNQLFRSQNPKATRRFMVVGTWESPEALRAAARSEGWAKLMKDHQMIFNPDPFEEVPVD